MRDTITALGKIGMILLIILIFVISEVTGNPLVGVIGIGLISFIYHAVFSAKEAHEKNLKP